MTTFDDPTAIVLATSRPVVISTPAQHAIYAFMGGVKDPASMNQLCEMVAASCRIFHDLHWEGFFSSRRHVFHALVTQGETSPRRNLHLVAHRFESDLAVNGSTSFVKNRVFIVGTEASLPLPEDYHVRRMIAEAILVKC